MSTAQIDYGDVPTWISSVGGLLSLVAAGTAAWIAWKLLVTERTRDRQAADDARRAQAGLIAAWIPDATDREGLDQATIRVLVRNNSTLPVYRVLVAIVVRSDDGFTEVASSGGPQGRFREFAAPGDNEIRVMVPATTNRRRVVLTFRDAAGVEWRRDHDGALTELPA
ncbi:DUF1416 domain-containing protein [Cryptosporangium phraense]|uniref:DUF1416 domain-containing protein n=1 Tax=Cryptosporangium phraense TaxID=2593070 RepID=UPI0014782112|nr:DUF1416 domain-containing protein [Cryptosporangium phraense]